MRRRAEKPTKGERREKRKQPKMAVSGRGVFVIQRLKRRKAP